VFFEQCFLAHASGFCIKGSRTPFGCNCLFFVPLPGVSLRSTPRLLSATLPASKCLYNLPLEIYFAHKELVPALSGTRSRKMAYAGLPAFRCFPLKSTATRCFKKQWHEGRRNRESVGSRPPLTYALREAFGRGLIGVWRPSNNARVSKVLFKWRVFGACLVCI
jgi:hypothetical protein